VKQRYQSGNVDDLDFSDIAVSDLEDAAEKGASQKMKDALRQEEKRQASLSKFMVIEACIC